ncbi:MAG: hypothetical protein A2Y41_03935 [Spirochaetes bacterium GWB1_36_13]|nr:MAG: hypothetical protein A2Y41_03935 [Spirochaetes bacterium GWB1_36_13]
MELPKKITPCPIEEAVIEIRFESKIPYEAVFGMFYSVFKNDYSDLQKLPVLQIPESVRFNDINLKYAPYYKLHKKNFILQIGARVIGLSLVKKYNSWNEFKTEIIDVITKVYKLNIIDNISRIGMRYMNYFNFNIFEKINFNMNLSDKEINTMRNTIKLDLLKDNINQTIQLVNNSDFNFNNELKNGSVIDIDSFVTSCDIVSIDDTMSLLDKLHINEKELFFSFLKSDFLNKELQAEY